MESETISPGELTMLVSRQLSGGTDEYIGGWLASAYIDQARQLVWSGQDINRGQAMAYRDAVEKLIPVSLSEIAGGRPLLVENKVVSDALIVSEPATNT